MIYWLSAKLVIDTSPAVGPCLSTITEMVLDAKLASPDVAPTHEFSRISTVTSPSAAAATSKLYVEPSPPLKLVTDPFVTTRSLSVNPVIVSPNATVTANPSFVVA